MMIRSRLFGTDQANEDGASRQDIIARLRPGDKLYLEDYSSERYPNTIGVETHDYKLCGFLGSKAARNVVSAGGNLSDTPVSVESVYVDDDDLYTCVLRIHVPDAAVTPQSRRNQSVDYQQPQHSAYEMPVYREQASPSRNHKEKRRSGLKKILVIASCSFVAFVGIVFSINNTGGNTPNTHASNPAPQAVQDVDPVQTQSQNPEAPPIQTSDVSEVGRISSWGDAAMLGTWEVCPLSFEITKEIQDSEFWSFAADEGSEYVVINIRAKNMGTEMAMFMPSFGFENKDISSKVIYKGQYEYSRTTLLAYEKDLTNKSLNPLESIEGVIVFSVPSEVASSSEMVFELKLGADVASYPLAK